MFYCSPQYLFQEEDEYKNFRIDIDKNAKYARPVPESAGKDELWYIWINPSTYTYIFLPSIFLQTPTSPPAHPLELLSDRLAVTIS